VDFVVEPQKRVPVAYDVDVVVAGAGVAGVFAAIAAARNGARTVLVDRFGSVGGNIGPGLICGGCLASGRPHPKAPWNAPVYPGLLGIPREFLERHASLGGESVPPYSRNHYLKDSNIATYVMLKMLDEAGVRPILSAYAADPIKEGDMVRGLFVETKSGRQAVKAAVVIDATGEADVSRRAGAPVLHPKDEYHEVDGHGPIGMGMVFVVTRVDWQRFDEFNHSHPLSDEDLKWAQETLGEKEVKLIRARSPLLSCIRQACNDGDYPKLTVIEGLGQAVFSLLKKTQSTYSCESEGYAWGAVGPPRTEKLDVGDGLQMSDVEFRLRMLIFERLQFYHKYVPGFENAYLLMVAPYLGARGGVCIEGEYTLTMDDCKAARRFDDVVYLYGEFRALKYTCEQGEPAWVDMPYRVMLPKKVDGLLAVGRCASGIPDTLLRNRLAAKYMGQVGGMAAAMAAREGVSPKRIDVKKLQRALLDAGFHLGDRHRLKELGLV